MRDIFDKYLLELRKTPLDEHTEHTGRSALETLLNSFARQTDKDIRVQHEPKSVPGKGAPDFKVTKSAAILGYVENKGIGENLDRTLKSDQIAKYKSLSGNILLTDYLHWIWIRNGSIQRETLCFPTDLETPKFQVQEAKAATVAALIEGFFSSAPEGIGRAQQLALALATRSQLLRDFLGEELVRQERKHTEGRLYGLFQIFRDQVFHELSLKEFADAFAQMLAYGLFLARLNSDAQAVTLHNAREYVPSSFRLIRELVEFLSELEKDEYRDVRWVVEEVLSIVNGLDLAAIHEDLAFKSRKAISRKVRAKDEEEWRLFSRDPYIYFYEDYLAKYDTQMRKSRGVYYTPPPVVNFIIRSVDDVLKDMFNIKYGLADHNHVTVLDFACGTGTFLVEVFERIFENIGGADSAKSSLIVRNHMLKNIYGFEYLIAPYTIAHLKLSQFLRDQRHSFTDDERLQVFLTNTLEPIEPQTNLLLPALTRETESAQEVKDEPILVITGNPPYYGHSHNPSERVVREEVRKRIRTGAHKGTGLYRTEKIKTFIGDLIEDYKFVDGEPLGEKNPKWLQDDYVKFIRFAQWKMEPLKRGIVGVITNHSWIDNPTFRGMRHSLTQTFDQIYIIDLHGSTKPKEAAPDGMANENVFDILKGVAITIFVKNPGVTRGVWYYEFWGTRIDKYKSTAAAKFRSIPWQFVDCFAPYYMFRHLDFSIWKEYQEGWSIADSLSPSRKKVQIFDRYVLGFQSHRDHFAIASERQNIEARVRDMIDRTISNEDISRKYNVKSNRDWKLSDVRENLQNSRNWQRCIIRCAYRPFDNPFCYFGYEFMDYPRRELLDHVACRENIQLLSPRQIGSAAWQHSFVAKHPANDCLVSDQSSEANYVFPLYLYESDNSGKAPAKNDLFRTDNPCESEGRSENLAAPFRAWLDKRYERHLSPEEVMGYIYAVLHAPTYRERYQEFLRIDFPRIRFPERRADFERLSALGWDLIQKHLLKDIPACGLGRYQGKGNNSVEILRYVEAEQALYINSTQHFTPVPREIWRFHIGSYHVLAKYLRDRKGRILTLGEIDNVEIVTNILAYTITTMRDIDDAYNRAFGHSSI